MSPVNFGIRMKGEVVQARDGDPVGLQMATGVKVTGHARGREGGEVVTNYRRGERGGRLIG